MKQQPVINQSGLLHRQAVEHFRHGRMPQGIEMMRKALELNPGSGEMHSHLAIALYQTGNAQEAAKHFDKAARLAPRNPEVLNDCGIFVLESGRHPDAEKLFRRALDLKPAFPDALLNLARSLVRQGRHDEAEPVLRESIRIRPKSPEALYNLGMVYTRLNTSPNFRQGQQHLEQAVALRPDYTQAWCGLIRSHERVTDYEMEEKALERAERHVTGSVELAILRITVMLRQGKKDGLKELLVFVDENLKDPTTVHPASLNDLGKAYDQFDEPAKAMKWFEASSEQQKKSHAAHHVSGDAFLEKTAGYRAVLPSYNKWRAAPPLPAGVPCPVFLVGFPRSGTTLLDQIFSGHPDIEVAEEKPALADAGAVMSEAAKKPEWEALIDADDKIIDAARTAYYGIMRQNGVKLRPDGVFIDKLPLHIVQTPLIRRLFPEARFILALRHPCDCVLSNYMQRFTPNDAMANMLDLADAARLYDRCFTAWEDAVKIMDLKYHTVRYEDVVADLRNEIEKALKFLGLDWQDSVAAFDETAKKRRIRTPSRSQVTQKLYTRAKGRWHKYREFMGDVPEMLRPWIEKFGYEMD
ncbi:MAG TPA: sulfotransferase [Patescibacteria group bacterium]|nr:sulfotransferase [Patescibacteria group bacterium]